MKKLLLLSLLLVFSATVFAQTPTLSFRFNNMQTLVEGETEYFQFDVEVKADIAGTYHRDMQVYFHYNPDVFGQRIKLNNKVTVQKIGIMAEEITTGTKKYNWVNELIPEGYGTDNSDTTYYITSEPLFSGLPNPSFHSLIPTAWAGYMRVKIEITTPGPAGVQFVGMIGSTEMMDGGQFYFEPSTGQPVPYVNPNLYENNLVDYWAGSLPTYLLSLDVSPAGAGSVSGGGEFTEGTLVPLSATPNACYSFVNWTDGSTVVSTQPSFSFAMPGANTTLTANFELLTYSITASAGTGGSISPSGGVTVNCGASQSFTITPNSCYEIADVLVDGSSVGAVSSYTFENVTGNHTIEASFQLINYTLTASAGTGGSITPNGAVTVPCGGSQAFAIAPATGYFISDVLVDGSSVGALTSYTFTNVTANHTITASFALIPTYALALTVNPPGAGTVSGGGTYEEGEVVPLSATASACYTFVNWTSGSTVVSTQPAFNYTMPGSNATLTANFILKTYTLTASAGAGGSITPSGTVTVNCGASQTFTIAPSTGYMISDVLVDGSSVGAVTSYTFTNVTANHTITASFVLIPTYTLALAVNPAGAGTVSGGGTFAAGAVVPLTATANACYTFVNWTLGSTVVSTQPAFNYTMPGSNVTLTANFILKTYTITASAGTGGSITPSGPVSVNCGASQTFTITAGSCYEISDVLVDGTSVGAVSSYTFNNVTGNHTIVASFEQLTYTITASAGTGGSISPSGNVTVNCGASQAFTIAPASGYFIENVLVDGSSVGAVASYTFTSVTANHTISASFAEIPPMEYSLTLQVNPADAGTVTGGGTYEEGELVSLSATANACYTFVNWTHGSTVVSTLPSFNYTMPGANVTLTANFVLKTYTITASAGTGGSITPSGAVTVNCGASQTFTIAPTTGYLISNVLVDGSSVGAVSSYTFTNVTANHTISASFVAIPTYSLTLQVSPSGAGTVSGGGTYEEGAVIALTATPGGCYTFVNWTNGSTVVSTLPSFNYTMPGANVTLTANFVLKTYTITASAGTGGSISPSGNVTVNCGASQAFTITPATGYVISNVLVDGSSVGAGSSYTFTNVTANHTISASFTEIPPNEYLLSLNVNPAGAGTVSGGGTYEEGAVIALTATPGGCYNFVNWTNGSTVVSTQPAFNYTMPGANVTLTANFVLKTYTITASAGTGGSITPSGAVTVNCGASQAFTIAPATGYVISNVLVDGSSVGAVSSYTFSNVTANHTISASFAAVPTYSLALAVNPAGAGNVSGDGTYAEGTVVPLNAIPNACYNFVNWTNGSTVVSTQPSFNYTMPGANVTLTANFVLKTYTITASAGTGGSITPNGAVTVNCGASQAFTLAPATDYVIDDVLVDGSSVGAVASYTFTSVSANHTISVSFSAVQPNEYELSLNVDPAGAGTVSGGGTYEEGAVVALTATASACFNFVNWTHGSTVVSTQPSFNYTMPGADVTLTAHFVLKTYTITASAGTGGSITPNGVVNVNCGASQTFTIAPATGYVIDDVLVDGSSVGAVSSYTFTSVSTNHTISASFAEVPTYVLTLEVYPEGAGEVTGGGAYHEGAVVPVSATENPGFNFVNWIRGEEVVSTVASFSFLMPASDLTLTAMFEDVTGIPESLSDGLKIYPNPAETVLWVELVNRDNRKLEIQLSNLQGQRVDSKILEEQGKVRARFNVSELDPGVYLVSIIGDTYTIIRKVVIKP